MKWFQWCVLLLGLGFLLANASQLLPRIAAELSVIHQNPGLTDPERFALRQPHVTEFYQFVCEQVPENGLIAIPPKTAVPWYAVRLAQWEIAGYLVFPRRVIRTTHPSQLAEADAIVTFPGFPSRVDPKKRIPYPYSDQPAERTVYCDSLRILGPDGNVLYGDDFEWDVQTERLLRNESGRSARQVASQIAKPAEVRFRMKDTPRKDSPLIRHQIASDRAYRGRQSEQFEFQLRPMQSLWLIADIPPLSASEIDRIDLWVWATQLDTCQVGLVLDDGTAIRAVRNKQTHSWTKVQLPRFQKELKKRKIEAPRSRQVVAIVVVMDNLNYLKSAGLLLQN